MALVDEEKATTDTTVETPTEETKETVKAETKNVKKETVPNITDIEIQSPKRKFRINGDNTKIIELNPSDVNIVSRLNSTYKKLNNLGTEAGALLAEKQDATTEEVLENTAKGLTKLDAEMRELVDYLFDSPVSAIVASDTNMYSPFNGQFFFEHVIEVLSSLYENNFNEEFKKMSERVHKKTAKYTGK